MNSTDVEAIYTPIKVSHLHDNTTVIHIHASATMRGAGVRKEHSLWRTPIVNTWF